MKNLKEFHRRINLPEVALDDETRKVMNAEIDRLMVDPEYRKKVGFKDSDDFFWTTTFPLTDDPECWEMAHLSLELAELDIINNETPQIDQTQKLEAELAEAQATLEMIYEADIRGHERWRSEKPDERKNTIPDRAGYTVWLLEQWDNSVNKLAFADTMFQEYMADKQKLEAAVKVLKDAVAKAADELKYECSTYALSLRVPHECTSECSAAVDASFKDSLVKALAEAEEILK